MMYNFFNPMSPGEANIYYLLWLLNSTQEERPECFEKAKWFIEKCYFSTHKQSPNVINSIEVVFNDSREICCMVNEYLLIIRVDMLDSLFRRISNKHLDAVTTHEYEYNDYMEKYNAKDKIFIFLETQYIGNILQIEQETPYSVFSLYDYIDFLFTAKCPECKQIDNEIGAYVKAMVDSYLVYNRLEYAQWNFAQHKGFYKDLQFHFREGEGKYNADYGKLQYFDIFETDINGSIVYFRLQHNTNRLTVRACFDSVQKKKADRKTVQSQIKILADTLKLELKLEPRPGNSKCTTLGVFVDPVIKLDKQGIIDKPKTIKQIKTFKTLLNNISSL